MSFDIPSDLNKNTNPLYAIEGKKILCRANKIDRYKISHKKAGGRGQGAVIRQGVCWIETGFIVSDKIKKK